MTSIAALAWASLVAVAGPPTLPDADAPATVDLARYDLALRWTGSDCGDREAVHAALHELAPGLSLAPDDADALVAVSASVTRADARSWTVALELRGPSGLEQRSFVAESCAVAIEATALVLAVAVDPIAVAQTLDAHAEAEAEPDAQPPEPDAQPPEPDSASEPDPPREPTPGPPMPLSDPPDPRDDGLILNLPADDSPPAPARPRVVRVGLALIGGGGYGPLTAGLGELGARVAILGRSWRVEARGLWRPPVRTAIEGRGFIDVDGGLGGLRGCGVLRADAARLEFPLCAGVEGGAARATAGGQIPNARQATQPYVGVELGPGLAWAPLDRLAVGIELGAVVPLGFGGFSLGGQTQLANLPIGVRALLGIELRLP